MVVALSVVIAFAGLLSTAYGSTVAPDGFPVAPDESSFTYNGHQVTPDYAASHDLQCAEVDGSTTCYDSPSQLSSATSKVKAKGLVAATDSPMSIYENSGFNNPSSGWRVDTYTVCNWYNLTGVYNDAASSVIMGTHTGFLSQDNDGGAQQISWGPGSSVPHLSDYQAYQVCSPYGCVSHWWNDSASSRRLGGC